MAKRQNVKTSKSIDYNNGIQLITSETTPVGNLTGVAGSLCLTPEGLFQKTSSVGTVGWEAVSGGFDSEYIGETTIWKFGEETVPNTKIILDGRLYLKEEWQEGWDWAVANNLTTNNETLYNASKKYFYDVDVNSFRTPADGGYFYRGLDPSGTIDPDGASRVVGDLQGYSTALPTTPFTTNTTGAHTHQQNGYGGSGIGSGNASSTDVAVYNNDGVQSTLSNLPYTDSGGNHSHTITGGDTETRPTNIAVHYIMKFKTRVPLQNELIGGENCNITTTQVGNTFQHTINVTLPNVLNPNLFINGNYDIWQRGEFFEHPGGINVILWGSDTDAFRRGSNHAGQIVSKQFDNAFGNVVRIQRKEGNSLSGELNYFRCMESVNVEKIAGKVATFSIWVKMSPNFQASTGVINMVIRTGTVANEGPKTNTATPYQFNTGNVNIGSAISTTTKGVWQKLVVTVSVPANAKSLMVNITHSSMTGTAGADDYYEIAQIKGELGNVATAFAPTDYGVELEKCKRRFERITKEGINLTGICNGFRETNTLFTGLLSYKAKRTIPTISYSGVNHFVVNTLSDLNSTNITHTQVGTSTALLQVTTSTGTAGNPAILQFNSTGNPGYIDIDAEI